MPKLETEMNQPTAIPTFASSTGEDLPEEWPLEGWAAVSELAREWTPPAGVVKACLAIALLGAMAWAHFQDWPTGRGAVATAPEPPGAVRTGTVP